MTKEEAAEILLAEPPFKPCAECDGLGFKSMLDGGGDCRACLRSDASGGTGKVYNPTYAKACEVLGLEPPKATFTMEWYAQHEHIRRERLDAERSSNRSSEEDGQEGRPSDDRSQPIR